ncbi:GRAM domain-containing protein 4-like [Syngnathoides biaculeatus]|uniref:GRAM domain-containing protein 4-like n=1 Tax=Syngnathoides biaculeatus TaxID=300417 RepID=UPI002ADD6DC4|nr:GRAM domain-containing protein 4-like [Syngnathoides biaculeatus]XP_061679939.1 GRAM domain-containing protein 4-like [Syngnathoides biaculeatus]XP_061679940.1 GRAM domain-containing protein 4-like [Syngnathoides biaculeatus]
MRRRLDRIRNWGHRRDDIVDLSESLNTSDAECGEEVASETLSASQDEPKTDLNEVKGHLEITLLEKHFLQEELKKVREAENGVEALRLELERERCRNAELERRLSDLVDARLAELPSSAAKAPPPRDIPDPASEDVYGRFQRWLSEHLGVDFDDFRTQPAEEAPEPDEPLSARRLTENMRRLKRGLRPISSFLRDLSALSSWYSVYTTAIAFAVYTYATWRGWTISVFLFLAVLRLSLNYLIAGGWRIQWSIVPEVSEPVEPPREDLTVTEKFQLVLHVAQRAQNIFGKMADVLEKIKNLFMWAEPQLTKKLYVTLWVSFVASCLLPYKLLGFVIGVFVGVKFFVVNFIFKSCPKLRRRYDTAHIVWSGLPTDLQMRERSDRPLGRRRGPGTADDDGGGGASRYYSTKRGTFYEVFNLPERERPLEVCENGWRCCLINRDKKTPADYIRNGVLYVTDNYLCFECSRSSSSKRDKVIKLLDIIDMQKYKVLSVLPGFGMGISIATPSTQKPMVFGAMTNRDEVFDAISAQRSLAVATEMAASPET